MSEIADLPGVRRFFSYARERHAIYVRRYVDKAPWPWTEDPILQKYRFCNVFRELDRTTIWFRENMREPLRDSPLALRAAVIFRWFNRVETFCTLLDSWEGLGGADLMENWDAAQIEKVLREYGRPPWTTGAYIVITPEGMDKLSGVLWCITTLLGSELALFDAISAGLSLERAWELLRAHKFMGDFMAYEVVTDLRHTRLLEDAIDVTTWANPGPGACRGMARVMGVPTHTFNRANPHDRTVVIANMRLLLRLALEREDLWPSAWPPWEMREVEHTLCEFDKYERVRLGEGRPKQRFRRPE